jgi:hypothetical protein
VLARSSYILLPLAISAWRYKGIRPTRRFEA